MENNKPCTHKKQEITTADLPLCCPMPNQRLWDGHPRVYLPIEATGFFECPYCETQYTLITSSSRQGERHKIGKV